MVVYGPLGLKVKWHLKSRTLLSEIFVSTFLEMEKEVICICPALGGVIQVPSSVSVLLHACGIENFFIKQFNILIFLSPVFILVFDDQLSSFDQQNLPSLSLQILDSGQNQQT